MTLDEAKKIAEIISEADSGCEHCVLELMRLCNESFPEFIFTYTDSGVEVEPR